MVISVKLVGLLFHEEAFLTVAFYYSEIQQNGNSKCVLLGFCCHFDGNVGCFVLFQNASEAPPGRRKSERKKPGKDSGSSFDPAFSPSVRPRSFYKKKEVIT